MAPTYVGIDGVPHAGEQFDFARFVVGFGPGGANDLIARFAAEGVGKRLGQTVVVENRPGADGLIGAAAFAAMRASVPTSRKARPKLDFYRVIPEWITGMAVATSPSTGASAAGTWPTPKPATTRP